MQNAGVEGRLLEGSSNPEGLAGFGLDDREIFRTYFQQIEWGREDKKSKNHVEPVSAETVGEQSGQCKREAEERRW